MTNEYCSYVSTFRIDWEYPCGATMTSTMHQAGPSSYSGGKIRMKVWLSLTFG